MAKYNPDQHRRRSLRLKGFDYSRPGAYYLTVCVQNRDCLFGNCANGLVELNSAGKMIQEVWEEIPKYYPGVGIDQFVVMPNHAHGIITLSADSKPIVSPSGTGQAQGPAPTDLDSSGTRLTHADIQYVGAAPCGRPALKCLSLSDVVHRFKTMTTKRYADSVKNSGWLSFAGRLWQRNYFEHVIRDFESMERIRKYIQDNPANWHLDSENPLVVVQNDIKNQKENA